MTPSDTIMMEIYINILTDVARKSRSIIACVNTSLEYRSVVKLALQSVTKFTTITKVMWSHFVALL
jgi:hypothetical protein